MGDLVGGVCGGVWFRWDTGWALVGGKSGCEGMETLSLMTCLTLSLGGSLDRFR